MKARPIAQIEHVLSGTATEFGCSYWLPWLSCPRRAALDAVRDSGLSGNLDIDVGSVFAAYMHLWRSRSAEDPKAEALLRRDKPVRFVAEGLVAASYLDSVVQEAQRVFRLYRLAHDVDDFGTLVSTEHLYRVENFLGLGITFDIRPDAVYRCGPKSPWGTGLLIIDDKCQKRPGGVDLDWAQSDPRFGLYALALKATRQRTPVLGVLVNVTYRVSDSPRFRRYHVPPPDAMRTRILTALLREAVERRRAYSESKSPLHLGPCANRFWHCEHLFKTCEGT